MTEDREVKVTESLSHRITIYILMILHWIYMCYIQEKMDFVGYLQCLAESGEGGPRREIPVQNHRQTSHSRLLTKSTSHREFSLHARHILSSLINTQSYLSILSCTRILFTPPFLSCVYCI